MLDRLTSMQILVSIADEGSISAAARRNGMSATMATKHLNALEGQLGVSLVRRSTRHVALTDQGESYLTTCRRILQDVSDAEAEMREHAVTPRGLLRMSVPAVLGEMFIAPAIGRFLADNPLLAVDLHLSDQFVDLNSGEYDLAIRITHLSDSSLIARKLCDIPMVLAASPAYLAARGVPTTKEDMEKHCFLGYPRTDDLARRYWRIGPEKAAEHTSLPRFICNSGTAMAQAAMDGLGIAAGPIYFMRDQLRDGTLTAIHDLPIPELDGVSAHAVYPAHRRTPTNTRVMVDWLVALFRNGLPWSDG